MYPCPFTNVAVQQPPLQAQPSVLYQVCVSSYQGSCKSCHTCCYLLGDELYLVELSKRVLRLAVGLMRVLSVHVSCMCWLTVPCCRVSWSSGPGTDDAYDTHVLYMICYKEALQQTATD